ncbi:hypothetical protein AB0D51_30030, partial [Streptomyces sp. NPDC048312]
PYALDADAVDAVFTVTGDELRLAPGPGALTPDRGPRPTDAAPTAQQTLSRHRRGPPTPITDGEER